MISNSYDIPYKLFENYNPYNVSRMNQISPLLNLKVQASWSVIRKNQITVNFFNFYFRKSFSKAGNWTRVPLHGNPLPYQLLHSDLLWSEEKKLYLFNNIPISKYSALQKARLFCNYTIKKISRDLYLLFWLHLNKEGKFGEIKCHMAWECRLPHDQSIFLCISLLCWPTPPSVIVCISLRRCAPSWMKHLPWEVWEQSKEIHSIGWIGLVSWRHSQAIRS